MKITVTGSLGNISKPLTQTLLKQGHSVTVVSSNPEKRSAIETLGAKAAIGSLEDASFLTDAFTGADAIYIMEPPANYMDQNLDMGVFWKNIADNYVKAILQSGVRRVVHLSSIGAHTDKDNGMLRFHHDVETILNGLPPDIGITFIRPVGFYYNLLAFIPTIRNRNAIITNYKPEYKEPWVSPVDIANAIAEEIVKPFEGRKIRYVASDELTGVEVAAIIGKAIGKPDLQWIAISDEQALENMLSAGLNPQRAKGFVEMNIARQSGILFDDYFKNRPTLGKIKMAEYAEEFARIYAK